MDLPQLRVAPSSLPITPHLCWKITLSTLQSGFLPFSAAGRQLRGVEAGKERRGLSRLNCGAVCLQSSCLFICDYINFYDSLYFTILYQNNNAAKARPKKIKSQLQIFKRQSPHISYKEKSAHTGKNYHLILQKTVPNKKTALSNSPNIKDMCAQRTEKPRGRLEIDPKDSKGQSTKAEKGLLDRFSLVLWHLHIHAILIKYYKDSNARPFTVLFACKLSQAEATPFINTQSFFQQVSSSSLNRSIISAYLPIRLFSWDGKITISRRNSRAGKKLLRVMLSDSWLKKQHFQHPSR